MGFKEYFGYEDSLIPRLATGFGGGVGRKGSLCGALTGSIMAIGMKMGRNDPKDRKTLLKIYEKCQQYWEKFEEEFGSRDCYALIGYHLDDPEENKKWPESGGREKCTALIGKTARMLCEFLEEK